MTGCAECSKAETESDWPVYVAGCSGCAARWLMGLPAKMRREAAVKVRDELPAQWPQIRARLDELLAEERAA